MEASPTSLNFGGAVTEREMVFTFSGPGSITTASEGAILIGTEPEDYEIVFQFCRSAVLRFGEPCLVDIQHKTTRHSRATLGLRSSEGTYSKLISLIGG
jgi:hypothetical protein